MYFLFPLEFKFVYIFPEIKKGITNTCIFAPFISSFLVQEQYFFLPLIVFYLQFFEFIFHNKHLFSNIHFLIHPLLSHYSSLKYLISLFNSTFLLFYLLYSLILKFYFYLGNDSLFLKLIVFSCKEIFSIIMLRLYFANTNNVYIICALF